MLLLEIKFYFKILQNMDYDRNEECNIYSSDVEKLKIITGVFIIENYCEQFVI